jgi:transcriptional regulator with GAF, ATPase, and Fis domain
VLRTATGRLDVQLARQRGRSWELLDLGGWPPGRGGPCRRAPDPNAPRIHGPENVWVVLATPPFPPGSEALVRTLIRIAEIGLFNADRPTRPHRTPAAMPDLAHFAGAPDFIYSSPAMIEVVRQVERIRDSRATVLISGESGVGKELVARLVHHLSPCRNRPFVAFSCSAVPEHLVESILFGHRRGAFTGAHSDFSGIIRSAQEGTLFLDDVTDLHPSVQPKLLRFLESGEILPLGQTRPVQVQVRVIAATNRDIEVEVAAGRFREDLYYRLNVIRITVPPLRRRREEIPLLLHHFFEQSCRELGKRNAVLSRAAMEWLQQADWPGNVRELRNFTRRIAAFIQDGQTVEQDDIIRISGQILPRSTQPSTPHEIPPLLENQDQLSLRDATQLFQRAFIQRRLARHDHNVTRTARSLGLTRQGLQRKLRQLEIQTPRSPQRRTP